MPPAGATRLLETGDIIKCPALEDGQPAGGKPGGQMTIQYKATYNDGRGLPEPKWGPLMSEISPDYPLQCPSCCSHNMRASAHPDDPTEIFGGETVRCVDCGHITDFYEAYKAYQLHYTDTLRQVVGKPVSDAR